eukprot:TRINITY_DN6280_c0_g1_i1.p1 TRINITY_DN6280_c0_g1~~TRINITY_DN6280_c0_g1_i1.p1  ORF type:complete len:1109 (+),score=316.15 TRINITY_DN6280_c0_g1_i1:288-3614(+)
MANRDTLNITPEELQGLQTNTNNIRNVCIVAHVDHGKTTLSDSLISTNGIISSRSAGKIRYMDHTKEEQVRGITMKASSISLLYVPSASSETTISRAGATPTSDKYLVNLIDSPGHMDFSSEVSSALRICDGCVVLVDVLEGVCIQTRAVLRQAWAEKVKPVLVLNKIDRLITELCMTAQEAYDHMVKVLQQVNVVSGTLWAAEVMEMKERALAAAAEASKSGAVTEEGTVDEDLWDKLSDADVYFSPEKGNVVFGSAYDGWGFRINHFADLYSKKWGVKRELLQKTLWGDYYFNPKTKKVHTKPFAKNALPMAVQLMFNSVWEVYNAITPVRDQEKLAKIAKALNLTITAREMGHEDAQTVAQAFMARWLPVSNAVLDMVVDHLPNPIDAQKVRIPHLYKPIPVPGKEEEIKQISASLERCDSSDDAPIVGFVSKVFAIPNDQLMLDMRVSGGIVMPRPRPQKRDGESTSTASEQPPAAAPAPQPQALERGGTSFIAMARLFSGVLRPGDKLNLLGVRYNPGASMEKHRIEVVVPNLFMLMGRSLQPLQEVRAGQVFGIGGQEAVSQIVKTATISSTPVCTSFDSMKNKGNPIVRVAVEPENPSELPQLERGLQLLYLADPAVSTSVLENGELVVAALGELHLHRCLSMLTEDFAKIKIKVSPPIVSFRESVISALSREHTQEFVQETAERSVKITVRCRPLPLEITNYLESNQDLTRRFIERAQGASDVEAFASVQSYRDELRALFEAAGPEWSSVFNATSSKIWAFGPKRVGPNLLINSIPSYHSSPFWRSITESSASVPLSLVDGAVVLPANETSTLPQETLKYFYALQQLDNGIRAGFQLATKAGPLCDEPMFGVAFEVLNVDFVDPATESAVPQKRKTIKVDEDGFPISDDEDEDEDSQAQPDAEKKLLDPSVITKDNTSSLQWAETAALHQQTGRLSGFVISSMRQACREAFLRREQRLVEAMYLCAVQTNAEGAGKVYGFLSKRRAKILTEEMHEGSSIIVVMAYLPAAESFGFAEELFRKTSGAASAQLEFDHWGILDEDPNFVPTTEEELEEFGDNLGGIAPNLARKHIDAVRRRKGLPVKEKKVAAPEKQRNLAKKK